MKKYIIYYKPSILTAIFLAIIADILFVDAKSDLTTFSIFGLYFIFAKLYALGSKITFLFSFVFVAIIFLGFITYPSAIEIEKASVWLFLFMGVGIIQELIKRGKP